jgi:outer membrane protein OmpA-like peptidoglycan-associated protein
VPQQQLKESQEKIKAQEKELEQRKAEDAALAKRFSDLTEYDLKDEATVLFAVNSAKLSEKAKKDLKALAAKAKDIKGYMIQVVGYADASGKAEFNQALSDRRAEAVTQYLRKSCGVGISRVLAPAALGTAKPAASNETAKGKAENRRVTVKVIVNRGMAQ